MRLVNLTPHAIVLQDDAGRRTEVPPSGTVARVASTPGALRVIEGVSVPVADPQTWGRVEGLPDEGEGIVGPEADRPLYIVSLLVLGRPECAGRRDVVAPGTGPNDGAIRVVDGPRKGQVEAVTRLVRG